MSVGRRLWELFRQWGFRCFFLGHSWVRQIQIPLTGPDHFRTVLEGFQPVKGSAGYYMLPYVQCSDCGARRHRPA